MDGINLTDHDFAFFKLVLDHLHSGDSDCIHEKVFNASMMFSYAVFQLADDCPDGQQAGIIMLNSMIQEAIIAATKETLSEA